MELKFDILCSGNRLHKTFNRTAYGIEMIFFFFSLLINHFF